jgi:ABC-type sugar transport system ATPase subunit
VTPVPWELVTHGSSLIRLSRITLRYGATTALDAVDFEVRRGEIHAIVGENGAGKSTLLRVSAGVVAPNAGAVHVRGGARLGWVPQETVLPPDLRVSDWLFLGCERRHRFGWLQEQAMEEATAAALRDLGCMAAPRARIGSLALPQRKQCQLARVLRQAPDVLLLDEPTAVLGESEARRLFTVLRDQRERGTGIVYVSHRLEEVSTIADRVTVLRDGRCVSTDAAAAVDTATLIRRMVGRDLPVRARNERQFGAPVLRLIDVATAHVRGFSLTAHRGEVVGLAGLVGAGRSEVLEAVAGLRPLRSGHANCSATIAFVPEDRGRKGLVPTLALRDNLFLPSDEWRLRKAREREEAQRWIARLGIRATGTEAPLDSLSGGNQQKLLLARALRHQPEILLLDEPTAGVDIGAKAEIHELIRQLAATGTAILLASSEMPELLYLCDRIAALRQGRIVDIVAAETATEAQLAALITGAAG